jgi:hypothetical protein
MLEYRFFVMRPDGSIKDTRVQHLRDDITALDKAKAMELGDPVEGWQETRMVFRLLPDGTSGL